MCGVLTGVAPPRVRFSQRWLEVVSGTIVQSHSLPSLLFIVLNRCVNLSIFELTVRKVKSAAQRPSYQDGRRRAARRRKLSDIAHGRRAKQRRGMTFPRLRMGAHLYSLRASGARLTDFEDFRW